MELHESMKCVVAGDSAVGAEVTRFLYVLATDTYHEEYVPTVFDNYAHLLHCDGKAVCLSLWQGSGPEDCFERVRHLNYRGTDVFLLCFSIDSPTSLENIKTRWVPELKQYCCDVPYIIIGLKSELRANQAVGTSETSCNADFVTTSVSVPASADKMSVSDDEQLQNKPLVTAEQGASLCKEVGGYMYLECSAKTREGIHMVAEEASRCVLRQRKKNSNRKGKCVTS